MISTTPRRVMKAASSAFVVLLAATTGALIAPAPAAASSGYIYTQPTPSYIDYYWDLDLNAFNLKTSPQANFDSGKCLDAIFDWRRDPWVPTADDHMDARLVRSCKNLTMRTSGLQAEDMGWDDLVDVQRNGACYGPNQATNASYLYCKNIAGAQTLMDDPDTSLPSDCTRAWVMTPGGNSTYGSAGDPFSCSS